MNTFTQNLLAASRIVPDQPTLRHCRYFQIDEAGNAVEHNFGGKNSHLRPTGIHPVGTKYITTEAGNRKPSW